MYWVKINGKDSRDVDGLFVASLPAITKPEMRVEALEIDGKHGDQTTELGFAAYDKQLIAGVFPDADVDKIISFFSGSGEVVFSNEPEKYYEFKLLSQINYEQVIRMRKAEVNFHVQPFKYSDIDRERKFVSPTSPVKFANYGNTFAAPIYRLTGTGTVTLGLDGVEVLTIAFGSSSATVQIDVAELEAIALPSGAYANRSVHGDYNDLTLTVGQHSLSWSGGTLTEITVEKFSRWI